MDNNTELNWYKEHLTPKILYEWLKSGSNYNTNYLTNCVQQFFYCSDFTIQKQCLIIDKLSLTPALRLSNNNTPNIFYIKLRGLKEFINNLNNNRMRNNHSILSAMFSNLSENSFNSVMNEKKLYTIEDLKNGKVFCINDDKEKYSLILYYIDSKITKEECNEELNNPTKPHFNTDYFYSEIKNIITIKTLKDIYNTYQENKNLSSMLYSILKTCYAKYDSKVIHIKNYRLKKLTKQELDILSQYNIFHNKIFKDLFIGDLFKTKDNFLFVKLTDTTAKNLQLNNIIEIPSDANITEIQFREFEYFEK
jgi:hypothetical protein